MNKEGNKKNMPNKHHSKDLWSGKQLIVGLGVLYAFIQFTTAARVYALNYLDNLVTGVGEIISDRVIGWLVGFCFIILIISFTKYIIQRGWSSLRVVVSHLLLLIPITFAWYVIFVTIALWICNNIIGGCEQNEADLFYSYLINMSQLTLVYILTVVVTYTYYYIRLDNENKLQQSQMETMVLQARMKMLRSQLHPHFLFNTLNSINSLMDIDVKKAQSMVVDLSDLLRKVLAWKDTQKVPLGEELALLKRYVDIEKMRFSEDLSVSWNVDHQLNGIKVPGLLLQPLVENAIHHGFSSNHLHLAIHIEVFKQNDQLVLRVKDNGQGFPPDVNQNIFKQGTGLQNTQERLHTLYGEGFSFIVKNATEGVVSEIVLPIKKM